MLPSSISFEAIGTIWHINTLHDLPAHVLQKIKARIEEFSRTYSRFREDSLVSQIAKRPGTYTFPSDANHLLGFYWNLYLLTSGKVTPLIGSMLERAGYDASYSLHAKSQQPLASWEEVISWKSDGIMEVTSPCMLDFGAAGKGYLVDLVAHILDRAEIKEYVIDASGDVLHRGSSLNRVGLEHPTDVSSVIGVIDVRGKSLCASASNRRAWGKGLHHIFDPDSRSPVRDVIATWVVADETMVADGLATALFLAEPSLLGQCYDFQYVRMYSDGSVDYSHNFEGELFS